MTSLANATSLSVPPGVTPTLVQELQQIQDQIVVLVSNHKILSGRSEKDPQDTRIQSQLNAIVRYIVDFDEKQKPIISKIRDEIKELQKRSPDGDAKGTSNNITDDEDVVGDGSGAGVVQTSQVSVIAKVPAPGGPSGVGKRKRRRKPKRGATSKARTPIRTPTRTPTPPQQRVSLSDDFFDEEKELLELEKQGCFKAHVSELEKKSVDMDLLSALQKLNASEQECPVQRREIVLNEADRSQFMMNMGLFSNSDLEKINRFHEECNQTKIDYRNLTYIPEFTEKKQRKPYNWLSNDFFSPPLLRTRRRRTQKIFFGKIPKPKANRDGAKEQGECCPLPRSESATPPPNAGQATDKAVLKRQRKPCNWLSNDYFSPPLLRTRRRESQKIFFGKVPKPKANRDEPKEQAKRRPLTRSGSSNPPPNASPVTDEVVLENIK